ncbi:MAG TPA: DEAD/DEAH box helicase family protein, partial [Acidimicrobiia bacterium]|nr:DEAD/DEAH box helicase family protein [Acidimicrobiia bacterium]
MRERLGGLGPAAEAAPSRAPKGPSPRGLTSAEKLRLFGERFRGRLDVFAKRWTNKRSGRSGYAPACANEWVRGVCEKPRIRCGDCPNQAFLLVTDQVLLDHLLGRHVAGVYPLLPDDTCWFLAADFDGDSWREDVRALRDTCRELDLTPAIERSRSGRGAHAWFFFDEPVTAAAARNLGCFLITETMSRRHELPMSSYDRLFPSQDTLPKGGFGNLIALPFQDGPRQEGNTVFLDETLEPHEDQWGYLASTPRIAAATVHTVLAEAHRRGGVFRVSVPEGLDRDLAEPWTRRPSGQVREPKITCPLPKRVGAVLAQRLFVEKAGLPSPLLTRIKRLAAFQNPEFYKKQSLRLSTALTPRIISCAEDLPAYVALPRGCLPELRELLEEHGVGLALQDERTNPEGADFEFRGELTPTQSRAAEAMKAHESGVLVAPPGSGKTVVGVYLVAERRTSTLILVHRRPLAEQWRAQLALFLGISNKEIGQIGGGRNKPNGRLDVAMLQSLVRKHSVRDLVADYGQVIVDECHHIPAVSFERVLSEVKARYVVGLTATPARRDGHDPIIGMQCGPVRFTVSQRRETERRAFEHKLVIRETEFVADEAAIQSGIQTVYGKLALD